MPELTDVTASLVTRPLRLEDADAVYELTRDAEIHDTGTSLVEPADIRGDWSRPSYDLGGQSIGYFRDGTLIAYGEVHRNRLEAYVAPGHRGLGIGTSMFQWAIAKAKALGCERIGQTVPVTNTGALELFKGFGCELLYTSWILELPRDAAIGAAEVPAGFRLRDFDPETDASQVFQTLEDAFNEWPNRTPSTLEDWHATTIGRDDFEPWQIIVVVSTVDGFEQIVGACKVSATDVEGWVDQIGVRKSVRGRGLGRLLLVAAFERARAHGASTSRLNTDSRTGALGLYLHVGMVVVESYEYHSLALTE